MVSLKTISTCPGIKFSKIKNCRLYSTICNPIITGLQDYRITGLQDCRITGLQDYRITGLRDYGITGYFI